MQAIPVFPGMAVTRRMAAKLGPSTGAVTAIELANYTGQEMKTDQMSRQRNRPADRRREPNAQNRTYDSNGPNIRIRGTARHIAEKYLQLARDAHTGSDPVSAENYLQHAEHYIRLIAGAQGAPEMNAESLDGGDIHRGLPDRFALPSERSSQALRSHAAIGAPGTTAIEAPAKPEHDEMG